MKKAFFIVTFLFAVCGAWAQDGDSVSKYGGPHFKFARTEHDFGEIPHKTKKVECRFEFTNDGEVPLVITRALTSCSCVKVDYDKKPVMPWQKGVIIVSYEVSKKESGVFYKVIEIYSNSVDKRNNLVIRGNAIEDK